jgi:hypothetical protein
MPTYDIDGHWFHSRSSSSKTELEHINLLVTESRDHKFSTLKWSETAPLAQELANTINIETSTMRTKIRAFIRFGFLKDKIICPLEWSEMGLIWESLAGYEDSEVRAVRNDVEQLIISAAMALYSFDTTGYQIDPSKGFSSLTKLILSLDSDGKISRRNFARIVGSRNETYWLIDFIRSGMFVEKGANIYYTGKFPLLFEACKTVSWPDTFRVGDWEEIHGNFLDHRNPLSDVIKEELSNIIKQLKEDIIPSFPKVEPSVEKMEEILEGQDEKDIEIGDYSIPDAFSQTRVRVKQNAWSNIVRKLYSFKCCVPTCDSEGEFLVEASHIKPYKQQDDEKFPHRANPSNGLCFCPNCHKLFDRGHFSFSDDLKLIVSSSVAKFKKQNALAVIINSEDKKINPVPSNYPPHKDFLKFHRENIFKK